MSDREYSRTKEKSEKKNPGPGGLWSIICSIFLIIVFAITIFLLVLRCPPPALTTTTAKYVAPLIPYFTVAGLVSNLYGYAMVFNQEKFLNPKDDRPTSRKDEEALCCVFEKFGYAHDIKRNCNLAEIDKLALALQNKDFTRYSRCVVVIMSHGGTGNRILAADGQTFNFQTMLVDRVAQNPTLQNKPKIFIVAACKGDSENAMRADPFKPSAGATALNDQPYMRDVIIAHSTYEGFGSWRGENGTPYVQELCRMLHEHGATSTFEDVLKRVNGTLTEQFQQVPSVTTNMSSNFIFGAKGKQERSGGNELTKNMLRYM